MFHPRAALETFYPSIGEHREAEAEVYRLLRDTVGRRYLADAPSGASTTARDTARDAAGFPDTLDYLRKHFKASRPRRTS